MSTFLKHLSLYSVIAELHVVQSESKKVCKAWYKRHMRTGWTLTPSTTLPNTRLRSRLHGSGQIFARINLAPFYLAFTRTGGTRRTFEQPRVQVWDLLFSGPKLAFLAVQKFVQFLRSRVSARWNRASFIRAKICPDPCKFSNCSCRWRTARVQNKCEIPIFLLTGEVTGKM